MQEKENQTGSKTQLVLAPESESFGRIVVIKRNGQDSASFELVDNVYTFGKAEECDIRIQLESIEAEHCRIIRNEFGQAILENVSIELGTMINSEKTKENLCILKHNDIITIVERSFRYEYTPEMLARHQLVSTQVSSSIVMTSETPRKSSSLAVNVFSISEVPSSPSTPKTPINPTLMKISSSNEQTPKSPLGSITVDSEISTSPKLSPRINEDRSASNFVIASSSLASEVTCAHDTEQEALNGAMATETFIEEVPSTEENVSIIPMELLVENPQMDEKENNETPFKSIDSTAEQHTELPCIAEPTESEAACALNNSIEAIEQVVCEPCHFEMDVACENPLEGSITREEVQSTQEVHIESMACEPVIETIETAEMSCGAVQEIQCMEIASEIVVEASVVEEVSCGHEVSFNNFSCEHKVPSVNEVSCEVSQDMASIEELTCETAQGVSCEAIEVYCKVDQKAALPCGEPEVSDAVVAFVECPQEPTSTCSTGSTADYPPEVAVEHPVPDVFVEAAEEKLISEDENFPVTQDDAMFTEGSEVKHESVEFKPSQDFKEDAEIMEKSQESRLSSKNTEATAVEEMATIEIESAEAEDIGMLANSSPAGTHSNPATPRSARNGSSTKKRSTTLTVDGDGDGASENAEGKDQQQNTPGPRRKSTRAHVTLTPTRSEGRVTRSRSTPMSTSASEASATMTLSVSRRLSDENSKGRQNMTKMDSSATTKNEDASTPSRRSTRSTRSAQ